MTSTFHICWGAQAGLYYHFGLNKVLLPQKLFGVYAHRVLNRKVPLVRGFDDIFYIPHSRHTAVPAEAIHACPSLLVMAESDEAGVLLCMAEEGKQIFVMGHPEYDRYTLHNEYIRDKEKGLPISLPVNYYPEDDCTKRPLLLWRSHCNDCLLYTSGLWRKKMARAGESLTGKAGYRSFCFVRWSGEAARMQGADTTGYRRLNDSL